MPIDQWEKPEAENGGYGVALGSVLEYGPELAKGWKMRRPGLLLACVTAVLSLIFFEASTAIAQSKAAGTSSSHGGAMLPPLDHWKAAVLSGDKDKILSFYAPDPQAVAQTPQVKIAGAAAAAAEEANFWSGLAAAGLSEMVVKVLQKNSPQPGVTSVVLRLEMKFESKNESHQSLVAIAQVWEHKDNEWHILATKRTDMNPLPTISLPQPKVPNTQLYPDVADAHKELDEALAAAKADHKRVLVIFGANWCYDCHVLDATLRSKQFASLVASNYHVIYINIGDDGTSNSDLADRFQVPLKKGIPSLAVLDGSGDLITSQKQGEFESAAKIGIADVSAFLNRWKPPMAESVSAH